MMREKESGHPSDTGMTARKCEHKSTLHSNYTTGKNKMQGAISILFTLVLMLLTLWVVLDVSAQNSIELKPIEHKVTYGETLWSIADKYIPEGMTKDRYMAWVYEHNEGGMIYPGDVVIMAEVAK